MNFACGPVRNSASVCWFGTKAIRGTEIIWWPSVFGLADDQFRTGPVTYPARPSAGAPRIASSRRADRPEMDAEAERKSRSCRSADRKLKWLRPFRDALGREEDCTSSPWTGRPLPLRRRLSRGQLLHTSGAAEEVLSPRSSLLLLRRRIIITMRDSKQIHSVHIN